MSLSSEGPPLKLFAHEIAAWSDAEIIQHIRNIEELQPPGQAILIDIQNPQNLPDSFYKRMRLIYVISDIMPIISNTEAAIWSAQTTICPESSQSIGPKPS